MGAAALELIVGLIAEEGLELLNQQIAESGELQPGLAKQAIVKFVEESDVRERYGLEKAYSESIEDLFQKLRTEEWYVWMAATSIKGTNAHKNWRYFSGRCLFNNSWYHEMYDGNPEAKMFLKVHLHILLAAVGLSDLEYRETDIEKHWGDLLTPKSDYKYGQIWNAYYAYGPPEETQFFTNAGTLYSARSYKYLATVFNMYKDVVSLLKKQGKIESPILDYKEEYYPITIFASGVGKQNIT